MYNDQTVTCRDCNQAFTFTAGEQEFYAQRGFSTPTRCASCRASRKAARGDAPGGSSAGSSSGYRDYSTGFGPASYDGGDRPRRELFSATCASCGREAKVPFQPSSGRPVYCSDCFTARR